MRKKRRMRRVIVSLAGIIILLAVLIILLPAILNLGLGQAIVTGAINDRVQGDARIESLRLSWLGKQTVKGLTITDSDGVEAINVDATLQAGLLPLLFGAVEQVDLSLAGSLKSDLRPDGSVSFQDLFRSREPPAGTDVPGAGEASSSPPRDERFSLGGIPPLSVEIDAVRLELALRDDSGKVTETVTLDGLAGGMRYVPGGSSDVQLAGTTRAGDLEGSIEVKASATGLFDAAGTLTPGGAAVRATVALRSVPVPFARHVNQLKALDVTATTSDLKERLEFTIDCQTKLAGDESSTLKGRITIVQPMRDDGRLNVGLDNITGTVTGRRVPSALFQPILAGSPLRLSRDLGSSFDVTADFSTGAEKDVTISLTAEHASVDLAAVVASDRSIDGRNGRATFTVQGELLTELTGLTVEQPIPVSAVLRSFHIPARPDDGPFPLDALAVEGDISVSESHKVIIRADPETTIIVGGVEVAVDCGALRDGVLISGSFDVDDGHITFEENITNLMDEAGRLALAGAAPVGRVEAKDLDGKRLAALLGPSAASPAVQAMLAGMIGASLQTSRDGADLRGDVNVTTPVIQASASVIRRSDALHLASGAATIEITPALAAAVQNGVEEPVRLAAPATATITLEPFSLPGGSYDEYAAPDQPVVMKVALTDAQIEHSSLAEAVLLRELTAKITSQFGVAPTYAVKGEAQVERSTGGDRIAVLRCDLTAQAEEETPALRGTVTADRIVVPNLEPVLGMKKDALAAWVGTDGEIAVALTGEADARQVIVRSDLAKLKGEMLASLKDDALMISAEELRLTLERKAAEAMVNRTPEKGKTKEDGERFITVVEDVPVSLSLKRLRLPLALLRGEPFEGGDVNMEAVLAGGPLKIADAEGALSTVDDLIINTSTADLSDGVTFSLGGRTTARGEPEPGVISVDGTVIGLVTEQSTFDPAGASLTMTAKADGVPTVISDSLLGLNGLLVAAVGPEMSASFRSKRFSQNSGWLDGRIDTTNGFLEGVAKGSERALRSTMDRPILGELEVTPALRERLLARIHPLLADVRTVEHPIRFTAPRKLRLPLDGDVSRLNADIEIDIGPVEFDSGSLVLDLLRLFDSPKETVPGHIEPIVAKIRGGVVTYDRFAVRVGKYTLVYEGKVDLNTRKVDLRTKIPLEALAMTFEELAGYVDKIIVPLKTHGEFGDLKTEIDPDFDLAEAAMQAGFRGALNEILKDSDIPIGDIFDDLLWRAGEDKRKKNKKDDRSP